MKALVTGSSGLTGSAMVKLLCNKGWNVYGVDNDIRNYLFGTSTDSVRKSLVQNHSTFIPINGDIRNYTELSHIFKNEGPFDFIIHTAAQPAHEWSTNNAIEDFQLNAVATLNVLECYRHYSPEAPFVYTSSSKVYGDSVNQLPLVELDTRFDLPVDHRYFQGVDEQYCRIDGRGKSLFGNSKACGDLTCQEYARYFNLPIAIFRPVCISGSKHQGSVLHGYLAYLVKCVAEGKEYVVNGYGGKQVRDNIHAEDLCRAFYEFYLNPKEDAIYNIGAGRSSNNSILEALDQAGFILGKVPKFRYSEENRKFDHKWCIYSAEKFKKDYPNWSIEFDNDKLMHEICSQYL